MSASARSWREAPGRPAPGSRRTARHRERSTMARPLRRPRCTRVQPMSASRDTPSTRGLGRRQPSRCVPRLARVIAVFPLSAAAFRLLVQHEAHQLDARRSTARRPSPKAGRTCCGAAFTIAPGRRGSARAAIIASSGRWAELPDARNLRTPQRSARAQPQRPDVNMRVHLQQCARRRRLRWRYERSGRRAHRMFDVVARGGELIPTRCDAAPLRPSCHPHLRASYLVGASIMLLADTTRPLVTARMPCLV